MFWLANIVNRSHSQQELDRIEAWAHRERTEATRGLFSALVRGTVQAVETAERGVKAVYAGLAELGEKLSRYKRKRAAIRELSALSDFALNDIGLHRSDVGAIVEAMLNDKQRSSASVESHSARHVSKQPEADATISEQGVANEWRRAA